MSVALHMLTNNGDQGGLFRGAIMQSGSCASQSPAAARAAGLAFAKLAGCPSPATAAACLRARPEKALLDASTSYSAQFTYGGPELPAADEAKKILLEYEERKERPWEAEDVAEQRRFLLAQAHGLDAYATGPLPKEYAKMRNDMLRQALGLWRASRPGTGTSHCRDLARSSPPSATWRATWPPA